MAFLTSGAIPEKILQMLSAADRRALGKGNMTQDEAIAKAEVKLERELHNHVVAILRGHRDICVIHNRTDKKSTSTPGTPDLLFAVGIHGKVFACAWELKVEGGRLSPDQEEMRDKMQRPPNAWRWRLIKSVDDALAELTALGCVPS